MSVNKIFSSSKNRNSKEEFTDNTFLISAITKLKEQKNAIILAHYYQPAEVQDIADFVGDSLGLSEQAAQTNADIIVFAGVHFMAETAKILSPNKKVLLPDLNAGCSMADSCPPDEFEKFVKQHPNHKVVTYVNTTAEIKALSHVCCTSSNAVQIVDSFDKSVPIIFAPDRNLGNYIKQVSQRENMVIWDGACHVHDQFSLERILELKDQNPGSKLISHPECQKPILIVSDFIGSTAQLLNFTKKDDAQTYIVATEEGIIYQMQKANPNKKFIAAPPSDSDCLCNQCEFMKLITLEKIYNSLQTESPEIFVKPEIISKAVKPINKMLEISKRLHII